LARTLGFEVVAEGIETAEALSMLREFRCQIGQGFFFSNAIDGQAAIALLVNPPNWQ
jgi:EAL domain-containing protein (putative c-di-GMP-specific phosphodiesterase class I)